MNKPGLQLLIIFYSFNTFSQIKLPRLISDGAVLYLNEKLMIDNDSGHRAQVSDTKIGLKKGWRPIKEDYFQ